MWRRVEEVCQQALELDPRRRAEFLERSCEGDEELRRKVESLLVHETEAEHFMNSPALEVMGKMLAGCTSSHAKATAETGTPFLWAISTSLCANCLTAGAASAAGAVSGTPRSGEYACI